MAVSASELVLNGIDSYADGHFLHIINKEKAALLERIVRKHRPMFAVEAGTLVGYSAIRIARNLPKGGHLVSIEISKSGAGTARKNVLAAGMEGRVSIVVGDALEAMGKICGCVDFVFFDVSDYLACLQALEHNGCVRKGSVIVANNVRWFEQQLQPYLRHVRNSGMYKSRYYDFGFDAMEVSVRK